MKSIQNLYKNKFFILFSSIVLVALMAVIIYQNQDRPSSLSDGFYKTEFLGKLIESFPEVPVYVNSTIESSYRKDVEGKVGYEAVWVTTESVSDVTRFYIDKLTEEDWELDLSSVQVDRTTSEWEPDFSWNEDYSNQNVKEYIGDEQFIQIRKGDQLATVNIKARTDQQVTEITIEFPIK